MPRLSSPSSLAPLTSVFCEDKTGTVYRSTLTSSYPIHHSLFFSLHMVVLGAEWREGLWVFANG
jgi:hypothetical protein